jgi:SAM-dependent methyltransferase
MTFSSSEYWENRYQSGRDSGTGSYGELAKFKAKILNQFVINHHIKSVLEFGCGDGNQLRHAKYPYYVGVDISKKSIEICIDIFKDDHTKTFIYDDGGVNISKAELVLSLDVIFHLVEDIVYEEYMQKLFSHAEKYVIIYSSNQLDEGKMNEHVRHRKFTDWVDKNAGNWKLREKIFNQHPYNPNRPGETSFSDFYIYENV